VLIGVSTGGPAALDILLPALPGSFPLPVLIVQHMPSSSPSFSRKRLDARCQLRVREAASGESVQRGVIYIARGDWHMELGATPSDRFSSSVSGQPSDYPRLNQNPPSISAGPQSTCFFRSAIPSTEAKYPGRDPDGMGSDGLAGCRLIANTTAPSSHRNRQTSAVWGMPGVVAQAGLATAFLPLNAIAPEILRLTGRGQREAFELRESIV